MARDGIDLSELDEFTDRLIQSSKEANKVQKKFLRDQGTKLRRKTAQRARANVQKVRVERPKYVREARQYHKSIKRGKLHTRNGAMRIRVYSGDPIAHLIEGGWTPRARDGSRGTKQPGKGIFEKSYEAFAPEYESDAEEMIDEMIRKI